MDKNPFSLYDFMGYLFPGCLAIIIYAYLYSAGFDIYKIADIKNAKAFLGACDLIKWESSLVIVVVGYTLGHILSYISSLVIEVIFTNRIFGYPSVYLLDSKQKSYGEAFFEYFVSDAPNYSKFWKYITIIIKMLLKAIVLLVIFPVSLVVMSIGWISGLNSFIVRPMDEYLRITLKDKQFRLAERLKISHPDVNDKTCDYHRIVMHYVYMNLPNSQAKTNNYLALYGFLRSLTFIMCCTFDVVAVMALRTIDIGSPLCTELLYLVGFFFVLSYLLYLGFVKFYRRFTLENLMCLLVGMPEDMNNNVSNT